MLYRIKGGKFQREQRKCIFGHEKIAKETFLQTITEQKQSDFHMIFTMILCELI